MFDRKDKGGKGISKSTTPVTPALPDQAKAPAEQVAGRIRLDQIDRGDLRFYLREVKYLQEANLKDLMPSIQHEGVQSPVEYFQDGTRNVLVKGHRRVAACAILARKGATGFREDMELDAIEVLETDPNELLIRSVLDNSVRKNLDQLDRIRAGRKLFLAGVPEARAAEALGISVQSYKRDLSIAEDAWMFEHVAGNDVSPTPAATILRAVADAEKQHPAIRTQVREELDGWIERKRREIERRDKVLKAKKGRGRGLSAADLQVKKYLTNQLAEHWADLIRQGDSLDDDAEWTFRADLDSEKDVLQIGGVRLDLAKDPVRKLAEVATKLSQLAKEIGPILVKRHGDEQRRARPAGKTVIRDLDYLRGLGLDGLAEEYELEQVGMEDSGPDGEEDPNYDRDTPRPERDLASEADAPDTDTDADPSDDGGAAR